MSAWRTFDNLHTGYQPHRVVVVGMLEPDLLERLRDCSSITFDIAAESVGPDNAKKSAESPDVCLLDHRSTDAVPALSTVLAELPLLLLIDSSRPPSREVLRRWPHAELITTSDFSADMLDIRLRQAIDRRQHLPADPIRRHAYDILEQVMHQTTDWIVIKDLERRFRFVSQSFADAFDLPVEGIIGRDDLEIGTPPRLVLGDEKTGWRGYWEIDDGVIASGQPKVRESIVQYEDENGRVFERSDLIPMKDDDGQVYALLVGVSEVYRPFDESTGSRKRSRSVTVRRNSLKRAPMLEQLHAEKNNAEARELTSRQAYLEKNRFIAAASHDLRQPLHALGLYLAALQARIDVPADIELIKFMKQSLKSISELLNSLLDLSRLDANVVEVKATSFPIAGLLEPLRDEYLPMAEQRNLALQLSLVDAVVHTDRVLLARVLRNLLDNAMKHTRDGSVSINCTVRDDGLNIGVSDTGPGIPEDKQKIVFDEFLQLENRAPDGAKGLGLGLAIVQRLCRLLDVKLALHSAFGEGARFSLTIPLGLPVEPAPPLRPAVRPSSQPHLILVVDDDDAVRRAMGLTIEDHGCEALLADSIESAIEGLKYVDRPPDVVLMDYRLGGAVTGE